MCSSCRATDGVTMSAGWTPDSSLSPRVHSVIEARLAQLSEQARDLVGLAAVIGREFSTDVLAAATDVDEDALVGSLDELWRRRRCAMTPDLVIGATGAPAARERALTVACGPRRRRH